MENDKQIYGLIGYPLGHSFSQRFFNDKFRTENINAEYRNFEIPHIEMITDILKIEGISGLNVTIPYKEKIIPYLDEIDNNAQNIGAVNVVKIRHIGNSIITKGFNSDIIGFHDSIYPFIKKGSKALILGTGGASKAVAYSLERLGIEYRFVSRRKNDSTLTYKELSDSDIIEHKIIINATPLGMYPSVETCPDIPYNAITAEHLCYDLVYNPQETKFLKLAKAKGATTKNGMEMLELQALSAWKIWND